MKNSEWEKIIDETPEFEAVFEVIKVPDWCVIHGVKKGDLTNTSPAEHCAIQPSYLRFIRYEQIKGVKI